jgi:hypothetical protein
MKFIQPLSIWNEGTLKTAIKLEVVSIYDDLSTNAIFRYTLYDENNNTLISDRLKIEEEEYLLWGVATDINLSAYEYVAGKLNLVLA